MFRVKAEYQQVAKIADFQETTLEKKTKKMSQALSTFINDYEGCAKLGVTTGGVLGNLNISGKGYNQMRDANNDCVDESKAFTEKHTKAQTWRSDFMQIIEVITTEVAIADRIDVKTKYNFDTIVAIDTPKTPKELEKMATDYISTHWGSMKEKKGKVVGKIGHIYEERGCPKIAISFKEPKKIGTCKSNANCRHTQQCVVDMNNKRSMDKICVDVCQSSPCRMAHQQCHAVRHR